MSEATTSQPVSIFDPSYWQGLWHFENMVTTPPRPAPFGTSTVMMVLFFGTNFLLFLYFYALKQTATVKSDDEDVVEKKEKKGKELSKPFNGTVDCFANLTHELLRTGLLMGMTYVCEYLWIFPHSTKSYSRDLFIFVLILFFAYAFYTIKPVHDLSLLGREQTEEWKGWMQFIFLLYHYFHAEEVYNSVRVMITCYVWMTGFGNFSFFYMKNDFSWLRLVQMLWRLNFSVLLLMWTHGNTYILYYICPLHTFYFLMVYVTMFVFSSVNTTKWGIRIKLFVLALIIYLVWDVNHGAFDVLFAWLGTEKVVGAASGSVWEWYFRTSLDHWSTLLGMIFALNYPLAEQYFKLARGGPALWIGAGLMGSVALWWLWTFFPLEKLSYNLTHSYTAIIPLTAYIFFRNITPSVRSGVSMSLHDLGKTTLETYLLQHHIWLSSNAKTLWTLTPGNPWINFALTTVIFFVASKELYRLTMTLRGMILPDDRDVAWRNGLGAVAVLSVCAVLASALVASGGGLGEAVLACFALSAAVLVVVGRLSAGPSEQALHQQHQARFLKLLGLGAAACFLAVLVHRGGSSPSSALSPVPVSPAAAVPRGPSPACLAGLSRGRWAASPCAEPADRAQAYCARAQWTWAGLPPDCPVHRYSASSLQALLRGARVVFAGDSVLRSAFHGFVSAAEPAYRENRSAALAHRDVDVFGQATAGATFSFRWLPFAANLTAAAPDLLRARPRPPDLLVVGVALWDALHGRDEAAFARDIDRFAAAAGAVDAAANASHGVRLWLLPTRVVDDRLAGEDKRRFLAEDRVARYRAAVTASPAVQSAVHAVVDASRAAEGREGASQDGVHYTDDVYLVVAQMLANAFALHLPGRAAGAADRHAPAVHRPRATGSMSRPGYGAAVLAVAAAMLFLLDAFLGLGLVSLRLAGKAYDWDAAYGPLHAKLGLAAAPAPGPAPAISARTEADEAARAESRGLLAGEDSRQAV